VILTVEPVGKLICMTTDEKKTREKKCNQTNGK